MPLFIQIQRLFNTPNAHHCRLNFVVVRCSLPSPTAPAQFTDRAKQSLFDILAPLIPDCVIYDLFAGTGSMGLECLSRGAKEALFFEQDKPAVSLRYTPRTYRPSKLKRDPGSSPATCLVHFNAQESKQLPPADLIFLDPPYRFLVERPGEMQRRWQRCWKSTLISRRTVESSFVTTWLIIWICPTLKQYDLCAYGGMAIELLSVAGPQADAATTNNEASAADIC